MSAAAAAAAAAAAVEYELVSRLADLCFGELDVVHDFEGLFL